MATTPRVKKLTSAVYSPTDPASEAAIRGQIDDSIQEVYDIMDGAKPSATAVLTLTNTTPFTPTADYHPSTKKYVDDGLAAVAVGGLALNSITDPYLSDTAGQTKDLASKAMPKAGGTFSGETLHGRQLVTQPKLKDYSENITTNATATGTVSLDLATANVFNETLTGITTFTFDNPAASGQAHSFTLILNQGGTAYAVTWPASVKWSNDSIPVISDVSKTCIFSFVTIDGGSRYYGTAVTKLTT